jgi:TPR repeat protein
MRRPSAGLILIISLLMLLMAGPAIAEPFEDATKAFHRGDYEAAYRLIKPLAEKGLPEAQFNLGLLYDTGQGVPQNYAEAATWYRKAAERGNAKSQYSLGRMYEAGQGVPRNYAEAATWYRKAAEQGFDEAQYNLGSMCYKGQGVPQSYDEAATWYRGAAEQGNARGQYKLGMMYYRGRGVPKDFVLAYMWLSLTTTRTPASEKSIREWAEIFRDVAASKMTPAQIDEAQRLAREWKPKKER